MGGMSLFHWIIILVIVMLVMGPSRLPHLGKSLGEAIRGFKKGLEGDEIDVTKREKLDSSGQQAQQQQDKPKSEA